MVSSGSNCFVLPVEWEGGTQRKPVFIYRGTGAWLFFPPSTLQLSYNEYQSLGALFIPASLMNRVSAFSVLMVSWTPIARKFRVVQAGGVCMVGFFQSDHTNLYVCKPLEGHVAKWCGDSNERSLFPA
jgi:hypothetical protein